MKKMICTTLLLLVTQTATAKDFYTWCVTSVAPTTSFITETKGSDVELSLYHHNGVEYAPFWSSIIVPQDLKILEGKADLTRKVGDYIQVKWPKENCSWSGDELISCMGGGQQLTAGTSIEPWALYSNVIVEKSFAGEYKWVEMTLSYYTKDENGKRSSETGQIVMKYEANDCIVSPNPIVKVKKSLFQKK